MSSSREHPHGRRGAPDRHRLRHLAELRAAERPSYPVGARAVLPLAQTGEIPRRFVGRVRAVRHHGGVCFADLVDGHARLQVIVEAGRFGRDRVFEFARWVDTGDLIEVNGEPVRSRNGTESLAVGHWLLLAKALHTDPRQVWPATGLLDDPDRVDAVRTRGCVLSALRAELAGFTEVDLPADPPSSETECLAALLQLVAGGVGPVFRLGRVPQSGTARARTVLHVLWPLVDYRNLRILAEELVRAAATEAGTDLEPAGDWPQHPVLVAVSAAVGRPVTPDTNRDELVDVAAAHGLAWHERRNSGVVIEALHRTLVVPHTTAATWFVDFPAATSPTAAAHRSKPALVERADLVLAGRTVATVYSLLTDPLVQRERWAAPADPGNARASHLAALKLGMPPAAALRIDLDDLLTGLAVPPDAGEYRRGIDAVACNPSTSRNNFSSCPAR